MEMDGFDWSAFELEGQDVPPIEKQVLTNSIPRASGPASKPVICDGPIPITSIGYFHSRCQGTEYGIIIDSKRMAHCFKLNANQQFEPYQFLTYEGDGAVVSNVIPICNYPWFQRYQEGKALYLQDGCGSWHKFYLVDRYGQRYSIDGAEAFVLEKLFLNMPLCPQTIELLKEEELKVKVKEFTDAVNYVSTHLQEIADSYQVSIKVTHISKIGGDDRFYSDRIVNILYEDAYLHTFFKKSERVDEDSGYSSNYDYPYGKGRQFDEEEKGRKLFLTSYNTTDHLSTLLYEYQKEHIEKQKYVVEDNKRWLAYWGIGLKEYKLIVRGNSKTEEQIAADIELFNHSVNLMK